MASATAMGLAMGQNLAKKTSFEPAKSLNIARNTLVRCVKFDRLAHKTSDK
ncbi:hypothetical protein FBU59_006644 [Linderina macrospora]|uniref:Uncharacterized protein n=1 Tax=Linderina macrospora TaxID=4868 RepID=A0ACC1IZ84_9FUNG|nr:hypothetical protein FBU59_006644 [Linderina macrospora]